MDLPAIDSPDRHDTRRGLTRRRTVVVVALAVVALAELGVRATEDRLPAALTFHSHEADVKVAQMDRLAEAGGADVVFVGTSQVAWGIRPDVVAAELGGGVAYNAALGGATPIVTAPWTLDVVLPRLQPDLVVVGVSSLDFQDSEAADAIAALYEDSAGARHAAGEETVLEAADRIASDWSALWEHRGALRDPAVWREAAGGGPEPPPFVESIDDTGRNAIGSDFRFQRRPLTGPGVAAWEIGTDNPAALHALVEGAKAAGTTVLLVGMPVTGDFIRAHPAGPDDYHRYQTALRQLAARTGVALLEYDHRDHRSFGDLIHLNGTGATAFSQRLAADLVAVDPTLLDDLRRAGPDVADTAAGATTTVPPLDGAGEDPAGPGGEPGDAVAVPPTFRPPVAIPPVSLPPVTVPPVTVPPVTLPPTTLPPTPTTPTTPPVTLPEVTTPPAPLPEAEP